jgi:malonyl-CoA decarboxylase
MSNNFGFLQELLTTVADTSRDLIARRLFSEADAKHGLQGLVDALMKGQGEATGMAIANQLLRHYGELDEELRLVFFKYLAEVLKPDEARVKVAVADYEADPGDANLMALQEAVESPRQEFFRRLNMAPGATAQIVQMRKELLAFVAKDPALQPIDRDLFHLLQSWFNRGFLVLRRIDWQTPASILEKIIQYEAVHEIDGWDDLRRRLSPADRRCFGFFHPSLIDEPLIFVEVALTDHVAQDIHSLLAPAPAADAVTVQGPLPTTAVFYSISNCQDGLRGVSFGNFLIKQVVDELKKEFESLKTFVTLSPVPRFAGWLDGVIKRETSIDIELSDAERTILSRLDEPLWWEQREDDEELRDLTLALAAHYFLEAKGPTGRPIDPVARFHLGNGARLEKINWLADTSARGLQQSHGLMVNYLYDPREIEANHEAFANLGQIAAVRGVRNLEKQRPRRAAKVQGAPQ